MSHTALVPSGKTLDTPSSVMLAIVSSSAHAIAGAVDVVPVPEAASLGHPALRLVVHVDDPEALCVAVLPLEVVEQGPEAVALYVDSLGERGANRLQVALEIRRPLRVVHVALPVDLRVVEGGSVLGDVDGQVRVVVGVDSPQHLEQ